MMTTTPIQAHKIAAAIATIRTDWDPAGIHAAINKITDRDPYDILIAFARAARNPDCRTPAVAAMAGPHWQTETIGSIATRHPSAVPIGDLCDTHGCHRDACPPECNPQAAAARRRNAAQRTEAWATRIRQQLRQETP